MSETPRLADLLRQIAESPETPLPDGADEILALSLPDTEAASRLADAPQAARFDNFYPSKAGSRTPSTEGAISKFLENYGTDNPEETSVLERLIFHPVADYSQQLARQEAADAPSAESTGDDRADRINRFILSQRAKESAGEGATAAVAPADTEQEAAEVLRPDPKGETSIAPNPAPSRQAKKTPPTPPENSLLSESLAKIYIKTGRYERAYEILNRLSLAVPEKNAYFADQLRFLRKLIVADRLRRQQNSVSNNNTKP